MDFGPTVLLPTTSATPSSSDTGSSMTMGASKSTMSQRPLHYNHHHPHHHHHHLHHHHHHHLHHQPPPPQQQQPPMHHHNNGNMSNSSSSSSGSGNGSKNNNGNSTLGLITPIIGKSNRLLVSSYEVEDVKKSVWNCNPICSPEELLAPELTRSNQTGQGDVQLNYHRSPINCTMTIPPEIGQRTSCSLCQENCASLTGNSCPIPTSNPADSSTIQLTPNHPPLLNSSAQSVLPIQDSTPNQNAHSYDAPVSRSEPRLSSLGSDDQTTTTTTSSKVTNFEMPHSNRTWEQPVAGEAIATVHLDPLSSLNRTKRNSSFNSVQNSCATPNLNNNGLNAKRHSFTARPQSESLLNNLSDPSALCEGVSVNSHLTKRLHNSQDPASAQHRCQAIYQSATETAVDRNEDTKVTDHLTVQRAGSVPNEASTTNPYVTDAATTDVGIEAAVLKRGSVNGTREVSADGRKSREVDNTTELLTRRTLNGGSTLSLTTDPRSRTCCFCWCCCCSCSCMRVRASLRDSKRPSASLDPQSRLDEISADEKLTYEEVKSWGESFDLLMQSSGGRKVFREFLRSEYSEENIMFWLACEELKQETNPEVVEEKARLIYEDFISILSPREVSLDSRVREIINANMIEPSPRTFDEAQLQIYTLMHRDSYLRFLNSRLYKDLLQQTSHSMSNSSLE